MGVVVLGVGGGGAVLVVDVEDEGSDVVVAVVGGRGGRARSATPPTRWRPDGSGSCRRSAPGRRPATSGATTRLCLPGTVRRPAVTLGGRGAGSDAI